MNVVDPLGLSPFDWITDASISGPGLYVDVVRLFGGQEGLFWGLLASGAGVIAPIGSRWNSAGGPQVMGLVQKVLMKTQTRYMLGALAAIALVGCVGDPYLSSYTKSKPKEADLIGTWLPHKDTIKDMRDRGRYEVDNAQTRLTLLSDGSFEMVDMPDWWREPLGRSHGRLQTDRGTWKLKEHSPGT